FLIINKIDQIAPRLLLEQIKQFSNAFEFAQIIPVSAISGDGVPELLQTVTRMLPPGPSYYPADQVTDLPERFIAAEMIREKIMRQTSDEIPYGVGVKVDHFEDKPEKNLVVIHATIHV
ncbi:MAG: GTPase Era, partial [Kiritimatiellia bacterium]